MGGSCAYVFGELEEYVFSFSFLPFFLPAILLLLSYVYVKPTNTSAGFRTHSDSTHQPETIYTVVLLTDYIDGALLKRAIRQSLSPDVKIVGGNLTLSSSDLAAEGAAKLALRRLESWEEVWRTERVREFLGSLRSEGYEEW
jgi:hypothetical protein